MNDRLESLLLEAKNLPTSSGCYLFKDFQGVILYIGKAKNLRNRTQSYFRGFDSHSPKTQSLVVRIEKMEFILTTNEVESFVLENNLIKKYLPKYNIRLKDDKSYPYVQIDYGEDFPLVEYTRKPKRKKVIKIFGPFPDGHALRKLLISLIKGMQLRDCSSANFKGRSHPCLLYQMDQCSAPCVGYETIVDYNVKIKLIEKFFSNPGYGKDLPDYLENQMQESARDEKFERASILRDCWLDIIEFQKFHQSQKVELPNENTNCDLMAFTTTENYLTMSVYTIRHGVLIGGKSLHQEVVGSDDVDEFSEKKRDLLIRYYETKEFDLPSVMVIPDETVDHEIIQQWWFAKFQKKIEIKKKGKNYVKLLKVVETFGEEQAKLKNHLRLKQEGSLTELQQLLKLENVPSFVECYDVAVWQGDSPTASKIVSHSGELRPDQYRYYHLKTRKEGNNDFAMLREVFERRLEDKLLPDVVVVDGGLPQWRVFKQVLQEMKINVPLIALAKPSQKYSKEERIVLGPSQTVEASQYRSLWWLLSRMRDEAHRFSRKLHHKKEQDRLFK
ncbi:MAG: excinuclease ABC subunit UvrC [Bacteriovoracaceae bacterium]|nr:excinuclease ABC subunit UvrC [Bacteriovoracaceae bacterium]